MNTIINELLNNHQKYLVNNRLYPGGMTNNRLVIILEQLYDILTNNINGDIVELGCYKGYTTVLMSTMIRHLQIINKNIHIYDTFNGLPSKSSFDKINKYDKGYFNANILDIYKIFDDNHMKYPIINTGLFAEIPDEFYPDPIAFALLDSDLYQSISDSLMKIYHKISIGGYIIIDDYNNDLWPGVKLATDLFFDNKPEKIIDTNNGIAIIKKV